MTRCTWSGTSRTYLNGTVHAAEACAPTVRGRPRPPARSSSRTRADCLGGCLIVGPVLGGAPERTYEHRISSRLPFARWRRLVGLAGVSLGDPAASTRDRARGAGVAYGIG